MHEVFQKLLIESPVILDGAWGTELFRLGLPAGECPDAWSLTHPSEVESLARAYADAGSRILLTNTFHANVLSLESYGLAGRAGEINRAGVALSRKGGGKKALVFGSIGPARNLSSGPQMPEEALFSAFQQQAKALAEAGADGIVAESFTDLHEVTLAVLAAKQTKLPVVASLSFETGQAHDTLVSGHTPEQAAAAIAGAGADAIGANCGVGVEWYLPVCKRLHASTRLPLWMKPGAGIPEVVRGRVVYPTSPRNFAMYAQVLANLGSDFIGGCCGTSPEYVAELVRTIKPRYTERKILQK